MNITFEKPILRGDMKGQNLAVIDRWISDTVDKLNTLQLFIRKQEELTGGEEGLTTRADAMEDRAGRIEENAAALADELSALSTVVAGKAPTSHASTATTYGQGDGTNYGHVKLSDTYNSLISGADAAGGVGASQNALYNACDSMQYDLENGVLIPKTAKYLSTPNTGGYATDDYGNFIHKSTTATGNWAVFAHDGSTKALQVYFETGRMISMGKNITLAAGMTVTLGGVWPGHITNAQKQIIITVGTVPIVASSVSCTSLSVIVRTAQGGYPYMCYGSSNNTYVQLGSNAVSIWSGGAAAHTNGVSSLTPSILANRCGVQLTVSLTNTLRSNAGTTVVTNNQPVTVVVSASVTFA